MARWNTWERPGRQRDMVRLKWRDWRDDWAVSSHVHAAEANVTLIHLLNKILHFLHNQNAADRLDSESGLRTLKADRLALDGCRSLLEDPLRTRLLCDIMNSITRTTLPIYHAVNLLFRMIRNTTRRCRQSSHERCDPSYEGFRSWAAHFYAHVVSADSSLRSVTVYSAWPILSDKSYPEPVE